MGRFATVAVWVAGGVVAAAVWSPVWAQKAGACKDVPIRWFVYPSASAENSSITAAIRGDGNWYSGSNGNSNSVIHVCGANPSGDATLGVGRKRKMYVDLSTPVQGTGANLTGTYAGSPFVNVRNLMHDRNNPFTTRMTMTLFQFVSGGDYRVWFMSPAAETALRSYDDLTVNTPYDTSLVIVEPQAYDCHSGGNTLPAWIVRGVQPSATPQGDVQVATVTHEASSGRVHKGQYSMPFEIRIEATTCIVR